MITLYTIDGDEGDESRVKEGAHFSTSKEHAAQNYNVEWVDADFGDCWIKLSTEPDSWTLQHLADKHGLPSADLIRVREPGTHPGLGYWLTINNPIMLGIIEPDE